MRVPGSVAELSRASVWVSVGDECVQEAGILLQAFVAGTTFPSLDAAAGRTFLRAGCFPRCAALLDAGYSHVCFQLRHVPIS